MDVKAIKSKLITEGASIFNSILTSLHGAKLKNRDILVIASKVVAIAEKRIKKINSAIDFNELVNRESEKNLGGSKVNLSIKNNIFIPWAGVDISNVKKGYAVTWPVNPYESAYGLWKKLKQHYKLKEFGIIISDSYCTPLRNGVTAVAIGYAGIKGVNDLRGKKDLYGNKLKVSKQGIADMLAASAHLVMGESDEKTPFVIIRNAPVKFTGNKTDPGEAVINAKECVYAPLYANLP